MDGTADRYVEVYPASEGFVGLRPSALGADARSTTESFNESPARRGSVCAAAAATVVDVELTDPMRSCGRLPPGSGLSAGRPGPSRARSVRSITGRTRHFVNALARTSSSRRSKPGGRPPLDGRRAGDSRWRAIRRLATPRGAMVAGRVPPAAHDARAELDEALAVSTDYRTMTDDRHRRLRLACRRLFHRGRVVPAASDQHRLRLNVAPSSRAWPATGARRDRRSLGTQARRGDALRRVSGPISSRLAQKRLNRHPAVTTATKPAAPAHEGRATCRARRRGPRLSTTPRSAHRRPGMGTAAAHRFATRAGMEAPMNRRRFLRQSAPAVGGLDVVSRPALGRGAAPAECPTASA